MTHDADAARVVLDGLEPVHLVDGAALWTRWCDDARPLRRGEWVSLSAAQRRSWLTIALHAWGSHGWPEPLPEGATAILDGRLVTDETSFFLALGEALGGPGAYVGANLDGLDDCLMGGPSYPGTGAGRRVEWSSSEVLSAGLSEYFVATVRSICADRGLALELA